MKKLLLLTIFLSLFYCKKEIEERMVVTSTYGEVLINENKDNVHVGLVVKQGDIIRTENGKESQRTVWPFTIGYFTSGRVLVAWCEEQKDYRHFKTDKIISFEVLSEHYSRPRDHLFREWQALQLRVV